MSITAMAGCVNYACAPSDCVCVCYIHPAYLSVVPSFVNYMLWWCETCRVVTVPTGTRAPGLTLSISGMHQDQLFLNHMTPLLPPSGPRLPSHLPVEPFVTAMASEVEGDDNFRAHSWRKPTKLFHRVTRRGSELMIRSPGTTNFLVKRRQMEH